MQELEEYCVQWKNPRTLFCLDLFSKSQRIARTFQKSGWASAAFDIARNPDEDILARDGFYRALDLTLSFFRSQSRATCFLISLYLIVSNCPTCFSNFQSGPVLLTCFDMLTSWLPREGGQSGTIQKQNAKILVFENS